MSNVINLQMIVKHLANGTISQKLCRICLMPLDELYEDVFTKICKENNEYCVADVLEEVCNVEIDKSEDFKVCPKCFLAAGDAYKFYLQTLRSQEILHFYIDKLNLQLSIDIPEHLNAENICFSLPLMSPQIKIFNYDILHHPYKRLSDNEKEENNINVNSDLAKNVKIEPTDKLIETKPLPKKKYTRKRNTMAYKMCSRCPIQYRFVGKLKEHMKTAHGVDLFVCQVCKALIEDQHEFNNHLQAHTGIHTCEKCNMVFKKRKKIIEHLKLHEEIMITSQEGIYVCEVCGVLLANEADLKEHTDKKHVNKYTCYYCGRRYKMQQSFELHIKKHEMHMNSEVKDKPMKVKVEKKFKQYTCSQCGNEFVDERSLLWHERLHFGERPYECGSCGRRFVSLNRRNQHALCSHTAPTRRCPLCPALFHLRSMVNTHIKKVHLRTHKRRNRHCKRREVFWKTETVPIQELSVSVQNEILKLQTAQSNKEL